MPSCVSSQGERERVRVNVGLGRWGDSGQRRGQEAAHCENVGLQTVKSVCAVRSSRAGGVIRRRRRGGTMDYVYRACVQCELCGKERVRAASIHGRRASIPQRAQRRACVSPARLVWKAGKKQASFTTGRAEPLAWVSEARRDLHRMCRQGGRWCHYPGGRRTPR